MFFCCCCFSNVYQPYKPFPSGRYDMNHRSLCYRMNWSTLQAELCMPIEVWRILKVNIVLFNTSDKRAVSSFFTLSKVRSGVQHLNGNSLIAQRACLPNQPSPAFIKNRERIFQLFK